MPFVAMIVAISASSWGGAANAREFSLGEDWKLNLDNSLQQSVGMRTQSRNPYIANNLTQSQGDYKFDRGDIITNRIQDLIEIQAVRGKDLGFRTTASLWYDFAYDDNAKTNPSSSAYGAINAYPSGKYGNYGKRFFLYGGELLDAFAFANTEIAGMPTYLKLGRFSQQWGTAFFFGFPSIAYSQHPVDFIKGFSQPGSEVKELFLPRTQAMLTVALSSELSVSGQYFFEFRPNRYPEGGTYFGFVDFLFNGTGPGALGAYGFTQNDGMVLPGTKISRDDSFYVHNDFGVRVAWSPSWAGADMGFYFRQFDEVDPWLLLINPRTGALQDTFAQHAKLVGFSLQKTFGVVSTALEVNARFNTALNSVTLVPSDKGATGSLTNAIANTMIQLGTSPLWNTGVLIAEVAYTHLNAITGNKSLYNDKCSWTLGCSTDDAVAASVMFVPQWQQVFPGFDFEMPMSLTTGLHGNPAYRAGTNYGQGSYVYSVGLKTTYHSRHSASLAYNGYHWRPGPVADNGIGQLAYDGGNGPVGVNDRGWVQLQLKTSF
jgi:hypothetical protein